MFKKITIRTAYYSNSDWSKPLSEAIEWSKKLSKIVSNMPINKCFYKRYSGKLHTNVMMNVNCF